MRKLNCNFAQVLILSVSLAGTVSCSKFSGAPKEAEADKIKRTMSSEEKDVMEFVDSGENSTVFSDSALSSKNEPGTWKEAPNSVTEKDELESMLTDAPTPTDQEVLDSPVKKSHEVATYKIKKGDTLMLIAYNLYGHFKEWKSLYSLNKDKIRMFSKLETGTALKYYTATKKFPRPSGAPYLIKWGDTLSLISGKVYGNKMKWQVIHSNNRYLFPNANLIFAGLTLYYPNNGNKLALNDNIFEEDLIAAE